MLKLFKRKKDKDPKKNPTTTTTTAYPQSSSHGPSYHPQLTAEQAANLERQRKLVSMQKTIEEIKERIDINYQKIDKKQALVKDLIRNKKKVEAKRQLLSLKQLQEEVAKQENMCIMLEKAKIQLEGTQDTKSVVDALKSASEMQKDVERNRDYLEDFLTDKREMDAQNAEIGNLLNDIAAGDQDERDEIDRLYDEMEGQALDEVISKVNREPLKNVERVTIQQTTVQTNQQVETKKVEESTIDDLLAQAAGYS